ncbi:DUF6090 family protein [Mangrovibacterium diazotrophicum]|uniref:Uncharacterized protein n=1 Tax=Mangrovibacterium diazotrophicum TaxID=1261403 RepID=A0A419W9N4_9BACT|nr:DUF6090 family protein [Mangrovibacterium diazotrophicum]RKD92134.1 hypothetical protein BC643_2504 [Mangrovibacterium diazotrophicum]
MLHFFPKIRYQLASENRVAKYLRYAIGEILLVVIGILIAVQINNWNENRKKNQSVEQLITVLTKDLEFNIVHSSELIEWSYERDSIFQLITTKKVTREMLIKNPNLIIKGGSATRRYPDENLNDILAGENYIPERYSGLVPDLKELKVLLESQKKWETAVLEFNENWAKYQNDNLPWLHQTDPASKEAKLDYYLNDPYYINRLYWYATLQFDENTYDATKISSLSVALLWLINAVKVNPDKIDFMTFMKQHGFVPFEEKDSNASFDSLEYRTQFRMSFPIYNNLGSAVTLKRTSADDGETTTYTLPDSPEFYFFPNLNHGDIWEYSDKNGNVRKYRSTRNGYLIIQ